MTDVSNQSDFLQKFIAEHQVPRESVEYFQKSWVRPHLESSSYRSIPTFSRVLKRTGEDYFFSRTVATPQTIPHLVSLQRKSFPSPPETARGDPIPAFDGPPIAVATAPSEPDTVFLLSLANPGLDGHPSIMHGGMCCAILDEMMGLCVMLHHQKVSGPRDSLFTVNLNVTYKAPVPTPSDVLVKCWLEARQGRKWYSIGQITDKDGTVLTEGRGIWVMTKKNKI
jgi:acyl-coenzyme A thioesterase PaaI-like protein